MQNSINKLKEHYDALVSQYGDSPQASQWSDVVTQEKRFEVLLEIDDLCEARILDFGCNTGHLLTYIKKQDFKIGSYVGVDISEKALLIARQKHPESLFLNYGENYKIECDYVFMSGLFNNLMEESASYYKKILEEVFPLASRGLAFNMLSSYVDYYDEGLFYEKPENVFCFAKEKLTHYVALRNDYQIKAGVLPYEFTVYLYKR